VPIPMQFADALFHKIDGFRRNSTHPTGLFSILCLEYLAKQKHSGLKYADMLNEVDMAVKSQAIGAKRR